MIRHPLVSHQPGLYLYARFVACTTLLLLIAGGLVTSTESGLAVPDWPLSYGTLFPRMVGGIRFEHSHRVIAGGVGILTLLLAIWTGFREKRLSVRLLAVACVLAVVLQAGLGGLTVIYLLPTAISMMHAALGQIFFCLVTCLAFMLAPIEFKLAITEPDSKNLEQFFVLLCGLIMFQLISGAWVRHSGGSGIAVHIGSACILLTCVGAVTAYVSRIPGASDGIKKAIGGLGILTLFQFFFGLGTLIYTHILAKSALPTTNEVVLATAHQTNGAVILALSVLITVYLYRCRRRGF